jgi:hypothetical protein
MDEESKELVEVSTKALAEGTTKAFLDTIFGPAVEVGEFLRDQVRFVRGMVQIKMFKRASAYLDKQGIPPHQVSIKLLFPLLELSSLEDEDDDEMIDRWAALLANAAAGPDRGAAVLPSFARMLAELSPEEAVILDTLYRDARPSDVPSLHQINDIPRTGLGEGDPMFVARCFNLDRLGLLEASWENVEIPGSGAMRFQHTVHRLEAKCSGPELRARM